MKPFKPQVEDPDQRRLRGLEAALAGHLGGHNRIENIQELRDEIAALRAKIFNANQHARNTRGSV